MTLKAQGNLLKRFSKTYSEKGLIVEWQFLSSEQHIMFKNIKNDREKDSNGEVLQGASCSHFTALAK